MQIQDTFYRRNKPLGRRQLLNMLPKVGDVRMERPTIDVTTTSKGAFQVTEPQRCVVVEVNREHLWYRVRFEKTGFSECYIVPAYRPWYGGAHG